MSRPSWADGCIPVQALLDVYPAQPDLTQAQVEDGEWNLPESLNNMTEISPAQLRLEWLASDTDGWDGKITMSFIDPDPAQKTPYSILHLALSWTDERNHRQTLTWDWTQGCASGGHALYPGDTYSFRFPAIERTTAPVILNPRLQLWGTRN